MGGVCVKSKKQSKEIKAGKAISHFLSQNVRIAVNADSNNKPTKEELEKI